MFVIEMALIQKFNISQKRVTFLFDSLIVLLNLSNSYSIIPYLLFFQYSREANTAIIFILNLIFLWVRFNVKVLFPTKSILFFIYLLINITNILASILSNTGGLLPALYLISNTLFYIILYNLYSQYANEFKPFESFKYITRGYIWLASLCIFGMITLFILIKIGVNPLINNISTKYDLFADNYRMGSNYFFPYISIIGGRGIRFEFFQELGIIYGLYHEPHIVTFMLFPALFLFLYKSETKHRIYIILIYVLILLLTVSTTNILSVLFCIIVLISIKLKNNFAGGFIFLFISIGLGFLIYKNFDNSILYILGKVEGAGGSKDYSMETIKFAFTPNTLLGSNFMSNTYLHEISTNPRDVGFISFTLNIFFLLIVYFKTIKLILSKNKMKIAIGFSTLYFMLHSTKVAMVSYSLSFLIFMIFLITTYSNIKEDKMEIKL